MCTTAIYKLYYCILSFSLFKHKANTAELHPKVRPTCLNLNLRDLNTCNTVNTGNIGNIGNNNNTGNTDNTSNRANILYF